MEINSINNKISSFQLAFGEGNQAGKSLADRICSLSSNKINSVSKHPSKVEHKQLYSADPFPHLPNIFQYQNKSMNTKSDYNANGSNVKSLFSTQSNSSSHFTCISLEPYFNITLKQSTLNAALFPSLFNNRKIMNLSQLLAILEHPSKLSQCPEQGVIFLVYYQSYTETQLQFTDLQGNMIYVFLPKDGSHAFIMKWRLVLTTGCVCAIAVASKQLLFKKEKNQSGALILSHPDQLVPLGLSDHIDICQGVNKSKGTRCQQLIDTKLAKYCAFHVDQGLVQLKRAELGHGVALQSQQKKRRVDTTKGVYIASNGQETRMIPIAIQHSLPESTSTLSIPKEMLHSHSHLLPKSMTQRIGFNPSADRLDRMRKLVTLALPPPHLSNDAEITLFDVKEDVNVTVNKNASKEKSVSKNSALIGNNSGLNGNNSGFNKSGFISIKKPDPSRYEQMKSVMAAREAEREARKQPLKPVELDSCLRDILHSETKETEKLDLNKKQSQSQRQSQRPLSSIFDIKKDALEAAKHTSGHHAQQVEQEKDALHLQSMSLLEQREYLEQQASKITQLKVVAYHCHQCRYLSTNVHEMCRNKGHFIETKKVIKRFYKCPSCQTGKSTLNETMIPACTKCGCLKMVESGYRQKSAKDASFIANELQIVDGKTMKQVTLL